MSDYKPPDADTNLLDLNYKIFSEICKYLDFNSLWREVVCCADGTSYKLSMSEVEDCAKALHISLQGSPTKQLFIKWSKLGMTSGELAQLLQHLHYEPCLIYLIPISPLIIVSQPIESLQVMEGDSMHLSCCAEGFPCPSYVWFRGQTEISNKQDGNLLIKATSLSDAGKYTCRIQHIYHNKPFHVFTRRCFVQVQKQQQQKQMPPSSTPMVTLLQNQGRPPSIEEHPKSQTVHLNEPFRLICKATGDSPLNCHWVKDGQLLGSTGFCYMVERATVKDMGSYRCIVTNSVDEVSSITACISEHSAGSRVTATGSTVPQILEQPAEEQTHTRGSKAIFSVKVSHANSVKYQWFHNQRPMAGATSNELVIDVTGMEVQGLYMAQITTADGSHSVLTRQCKLLYKQSLQSSYCVSDKVALVFGISTYRSHGPPLPAVENDLQHTVRALESLDFRVIALLDLTLQEMKDAVTQFCDLVSPDVYVVFYCAGHGYQDDAKRHYLIPWDAREGLKDNECLCVDEVEAKIQKKSPKLLLLFLDICRNNVGRLNPPSIVRPIDYGTPKPNRGIFYAASSGEQSFEEKKDKEGKLPRGIFNQYFVEVLQHDFKVGELFAALQDKFKTCVYDRKKFPQNPEMVINIDELDRSLSDPIDHEKQADLMRHRKLDWNSFKVLPSRRTIKVAEIGFIQLTFSSLASNVLVMTTQSVICAGWGVDVSIPKDLIDPIVQPVVVQRGSEKNVTHFKMQNIQRIRTHLMFKLGIIIKKKTSSNDLETVHKSPPIDLGVPLIAALRLGSRTQHSQESSASTRQPVEHSESEYSSTDALEHAS